MADAAGHGTEVTPAPGPPRRRGGMSSPATWIIVLGVALAGGAYLLYRHFSSSSSAAGTSTATTSTAAGTTSPDWSGEISTLQTEIEDLQSSAAQQDQADTSQDSAQNMVTVPRVVGQTQELAYTILTAAGLRPSGQPVVKGRVRTVTAQSPQGGARVPKGTTVKLTTRLPPPPPPPKHPHPHPHPHPPPPRRAHKPGVNPPRTRASSAHVTRAKAA